MSYANKYHKRVTCSYNYNLLCANDKFSKPFKSCLSKDTVNDLINSMIKESKHYRDVMKKNFNKEFVVIEEDDEDFENSAKCWICDKPYDNGDLKVKNHGLITGKYGGSLQRL